MPRFDLSIAAARRLALAAQGFADPAPTGRVDVRHFRRTLVRLGLLQLDAVQAESGALEGRRARQGEDEAVAERGVQRGGERGATLVDRRGLCL